ncbi:hypothetical protein AVEN_196336-1 [Araneus ventricosus]|uniref:Uncharacterized protein n=1 Tax=Araneus ventricosus TaxID=182803 RepID=A0A4Y2AVD1_ARAVE|nr:hypothetical protein AVEN_196336-1 [Araneus ventricosus]
MHVVVTEEMLLRHFQVLEQMVVAGSKIGTIDGMIVSVVALSTAPHEDDCGSEAVSQRLPSVPAPEKVPGEAALLQQQRCIGRRLSQLTPVYRNWPQGMTRALVPLVLMLRGSCICFN